MTATGWTGQPEAESPAMPATAFLLGMRAERGPVDPLERARLAPDRDPFDPDEGELFDPDERAANMVARGYAPGERTIMMQRITEKRGLAQAEREKDAKYQKAEARLRRMLDNGQIGGLELLRALPEPGDEHEAEKLERQAAALERQLADLDARVAPRPHGSPDPLESATRRAHDAFVSATRARFAEAQSDRPAPRPFAGRGGVAVRSDQPVTCEECLKLGLDAETSFLIHADPDSPLAEPAAVPGEAGRRRTGPYGYGYYGEITRVASPDGMSQLGDVFGNVVR